MSEAFSNRRSLIGSYYTVSNYGDYRINREQEQNQFHSIAKIYNEKVIKTMESQKKMGMLYNYQIKNNQIIPQKENNKKQEKVRKTRKDKEGRKFICGSCLLGYLSYPALYTHIKTKHKGEIPQGTIRGQNGRAKKRGRPKNRKTPMLYELQMEKNTFPQHLSNIIKRQQLKILQQFDFQEVDSDEEDSNKNKLETRYFVEMLKLIKKQETQLNNNIKLMKISLLMTIFLYNVKDFFDKDALLSFQESFYELVVYINKNYVNILKDYQDQSQLYIEIDLSYRTDADEKSSSGKGENKFYQNTYCFCQIPQFVPYFVEMFIKQNISKKEDQEQRKLIMIDFCSWLYEKKLTCLKLQKSRADAMI